MKTLRKPQSVSLFLGLLLGTLILLSNIREHAQAADTQLCTQLYSGLMDTTFTPAALKLQGKAFYIHDFTTDADLYGEDENAPLPLASLTKLMTVRLVLKNETPDSFYTIKPGDLDSDGPTGFVVGDSYRISDLIRAALIESSNDAAFMLAESTGISQESFFAAMNLEAKSLGLSSLHYESSTGLDNDNNTASAVGSAHDILMLLHQDDTDFPDQFAVSTRERDTIASTNGQSIQLKNTDLAIPYLPLLIASKTGYTDVAGGNLAVLWKEPGGDELGASVLGSTENGRFSDMIVLHDAADLYVSTVRSYPSICK